MMYWLGVGLIMLITYALIVWEDKVNDGEN